MPKVYDKSAAGKKQSLLAQGALGGRQALTQNLRGLTYEAGVAALGLDLQTVGEDPQNLGLDPATLTEDLALILKELQPVYDPYYLQCRDTAAAVAAAYAGDGSGKSSADGRFNITLNELVLRTTDICKNAEFAKSSDLTSRNRMTKETKRKHAEKAAKLLAELQRLIAAMTYMAAQVAGSAESTLQMQYAMDKLMEARTMVEWQHRTYRSEGLVVGGGRAKPGDAPA